MLQPLGSGRFRDPVVKNCELVSVSGLLCIRLADIRLQMKIDGKGKYEVRPYVISSPLDSSFRAYGSEASETGVATTDKLI